MDFLVYALINVRPYSPIKDLFGARRPPEVCWTVSCFLSSDSVFAEDVLRGSSVKFAQQSVALESVDPGCWSLKPKLHLWLEVCASGASPSFVLDVQGRRLQRGRARAWHAGEAGI